MNEIPIIIEGHNAPACEHCGSGEIKFWSGRSRKFVREKGNHTVGAGWCGYMCRDLHRAQHPNPLPKEVKRLFAATLRFEMYEYSC